MTKIPNDPSRVTRILGRLKVHYQCALQRGEICPRTSKVVRDKPLTANRYCEGRCDNLRLVIVHVPEGGYTHAETAKIAEVRV